MQREIILAGDYSPLTSFFKEQKKIFLVCGRSFDRLNIKKAFEPVENVVRFSDFSPNPDYEAVKKAVSLFKAEHCGSVVAVGGGSAMDLAKCVKAYVTMPDGEEYLFRAITENGIPLIAIPTTAGTGSESTRYAVIYFQGNKQSITDNSLIPSTVVFDASSLSSLPDYHRKASAADALCHAVEAFWSINSTDESKMFSKTAIGMILDNMTAYLNNEESGNIKMLQAANIAGKAINITQTTAGHAMCYKLTGLYGVAHGHAAALCVNALIPYMISHTDDCNDARGKAYLDMMFTELADAMRCDGVSDLSAGFGRIVDAMGLLPPEPADGDFEILKTSVNTERLKNHPIRLSADTLDRLYHRILKTRT